MNGSNNKEHEVAELLMELAEAGHLDHAEGCDLKHDGEGWYVCVTSLDPEKLSLPNEYKGLRLKIERPPGWKGHVGVPRDGQIKREVKILKPADGPILD